MKEVKSPLDIISSLKERFEQRTALQFYFSYVPIETTQLIKEGFKRCHAAVSSRFFLPDDNIFSYKESQYKIIERLPPEQIRKEITVQYDYNLKGFIEDRLKIWVKEEFPPEYIKSEACDILTSLFGEKIELPCIFDKCVYLKQAETLDQLYERLLIKIEECEGIMSTEFDRSLGDNELLDKAIEYIHEHYTQELTLKHVADHIHISRNYFSILFKKYLQQNFIDYVIELRIKKAKQLLQNSRLKVYEVADQSGFKDVKYFSKLFKRITGYSPGDYRSKRGK
jgi:two-component system response regulator YesN